MFNQREALARVLAKLERTSARIGDQIPYRTEGGRFDDQTEKDICWWTNGFWPGILWLAHRQTNQQHYADLAVRVEKKLDQAFLDFYGLHHDVGFMWQLSAVANYKLTGDQAAAKRGYLAASILASRFNQAGSFIRAWNNDHTGWAIIDCMMNLSILYWASYYIKDPRFSHIAQAHATTVMKHFIYEDGSSKHICEFDPFTGAYLKNYYGQGYSEDSAWSRGAAWALYGFALSAKYTGRQDFLATAQKVAEFFISHLPEDQVPFADFKAPAKVNIHKDSSAAAIAASGLLLLARLVPEVESEFYQGSAQRIVESLYSNYTDWDGDEALIQKGCAAFHETKPGWRETSLIYGDYYFLEALMQLNGYQELF